jgi:hypothetical protein
MTKRRKGKRKMKETYRGEEGVGSLRFAEREERRGGEG